VQVKLPPARYSAVKVTLPDSPLMMNERVARCRVLLVSTNSEDPEQRLSELDPGAKRAGERSKSRSSKATRSPLLAHAGLRRPLFEFLASSGSPHQERRLSLHSLRHGYASLLISNGLNVVFVSRQLGRANPNITLGVYAHLFAQRDHAQAARKALEEGHAALRGP
jgi:integrase